MGAGHQVPPLLHIFRHVRHNEKPFVLLGLHRKMPVCRLYAAPAPWVPPLPPRPPRPSPPRRLQWPFRGAPRLQEAGIMGSGAPYPTPPYRTAPATANPSVSSSAPPTPVLQMRLWSVLAVAALAVTMVAARGNRTKRQAAAEHCDPAYCQIPVGRECKAARWRQHRAKTIVSGLLLWWEGHPRGLQPRPDPSVRPPHLR